MSKRPMNELEKLLAHSAKRQERINGRVRYIEGDMPPTELAQWKQLFDVEPQMLTLSEKAEELAELAAAEHDDCTALGKHRELPYRALPLAELVLLGQIEDAVCITGSLEARRDGVAKEEAKAGADDDTVAVRVQGSGVALQVVLLAVTFALVIGVPLGMVSGYLGGSVDRVLVLLMDTLYTLPVLLLSVVLVKMLGELKVEKVVYVNVTQQPLQTVLLVEVAVVGV